MEEFQSFPDKAHIFKENSLTCLGSLRSHKTCGGLRQLQTTAEPCSADGAYKGHRQSNKRQLCVKEVRHRKFQVHKLIGLPYDLGEQECSAEIAQSAANESSASGVEHELAHDSALGIAESFENAYLSALLLHHTAHGSHTYQSGNEDKEHGEDTSDLRHYLGIALKAGITDICIPVQNVDLGLGELFKLFFAVGDILFRVLYLFVEVREGALIVRLTFFVIRKGSVILFHTCGILLRTYILYQLKLSSLSVQLSLCAVEVGSCAVKLLLTLGTLVIQFFSAVVKLFLSLAAKLLIADIRP